MRIRERWWQGVRKNKEDAMESNGGEKTSIELVKEKHKKGWRKKAKRHN